MSRKICERILDRVVEMVVSPNLDAGWHQQSVLQMMIEFAGDLPERGTGYFSPEDKMLREIRFVRELSDRSKVAALIFMQLSDPQQQALYYHTRFAKTPNPATEKLFKQRDLAAMVGMTEDAFDAHKRRGLKLMDRIIEANPKIKILFS